MNRKLEFTVARSVDVAGAVAALGIEARRRGSELWARCPFHDEKTPSWSVRVAPGKDGNGYHHCYGCGGSGGIVGLVQEVLGLSTYGAAARWLEQRGLVVGASAPEGVALVPQGGFAPVSARPPAGLVLKPLGAWASPARAYALSRGLTAEQVERWGIGYVASGKYAARIYLPAKDSAGRLATWTARGFAGQDRKYLDVEGARDKSVLFGEVHWPGQAARDGARLVVCEGELNALACERAGAEYVGALGSSAPDRGQVLRIASFGEVVVATDHDGAGTKAAYALYASLCRWRPVRRAAFPAGVDACDLEQRSGAGALREVLGL